ncbi:hypothetical protein VF14_25460 [Nostoc linckia z18]|uniref:Uncharacterized protein n=2 Tax=Nostoc linckia TaxID=92942 RepID=A0A9Q5Z941_NOSLI|nr:hypothetical protein [Nostoc linckia]PHK27888.1 hypothetical protein VF12_33975 [Nostoc linckia z15]PHK44330.1 hypothetical protein VF13_22640 [Nostoc linckia z16]PHJ56431.1 hypothetical protein VF03_37605 [Nostoc linckia z2]PHJ58662.1 hypothetical protein VF05_33500 [Nostoc linckia z3]PHJ62810.1 hypothetical protein VF02_16820 [Nostoc linckia z1]
MAGKKKLFTIVNSAAESEDPLLKSYTGLVNFPKSAADRDAHNTWQKIDRRGWADEYESAMATGQHYVDSVE